MKPAGAPRLKACDACSVLCLPRERSRCKCDRLVCPACEVEVRYVAVSRQGRIGRRVVSCLSCAPEEE